MFLTFVFVGQWLGNKRLQLGCELPVRRQTLSACTVNMRPVASDTVSTCVAIFVQVAMGMLL